MDTIVLELNNPAKRDLLLALLAELDFVSVRKNNEEEGAKVAAQTAQEDPKVAAQTAQEGSLFDLVGI